MKPQVLKAIKDAGGKIKLAELRRQIIGSVCSTKLFLFYDTLSKMCDDGIIDHCLVMQHPNYFITPAGWKVEL